MEWFWALSGPFWPTALLAHMIPIQKGPIRPQKEMLRQAKPIKGVGLEPFRPTSELGQFYSALQKRNALQTTKTA